MGRATMMMAGLRLTKSKVTRAESSPNLLVILHLLLLNSRRLMTN